MCPICILSVKKQTYIVTVYHHLYGLAVRARIYGNVVVFDYESGDPGSSPGLVRVFIFITTPGYK